MELLEQLYLSLQPTLDVVIPYVKEGWAIFNDYAYLRAGILIIISFLLAKLLSKHIPHLLIKLAQKVNFGLGEEIAKLTRPLLFQVIFFAGIGLVANFLELSKTEHFIALATIKSLIIIFFVLFVYKVIKSVLEYLCEKDSGDDDDVKVIQPATLPLFENIVLLFLALGCIHQVFGVWNVDMTALLASAGIAGLAIGMASKDTLSDVIAGILILTDAPYRVGDVIHIGGAVGTIASIGIRSTRIITKDNVGITVPNGKMGASEVINESTADDTSLRIKLPIQAAYGIDPETIREIMITAAKETENVLKDKKIAVVLSDFQQYQITFTLLCWIPQPGLKSGTLSQLREKIYLRFLKDQIEMALPEKRDVQQIEVTSVPELVQSIAVNKIPEISQKIAIKEIPELIQSIAIKEMPELIQSIVIKEMPKLIHSIAIKEIPELIQSIAIKEMPDRNGTLSIKEIPDLFGSGRPRKIPKPTIRKHSKPNHPVEKNSKPSSKKDKE